MRNRSHAEHAQKIYDENRWWVENAYAGKYLIIDAQTGALMTGEDHDDAIKNCRIARWDSSVDYYGPQPRPRTLNRFVRLLRSLRRARTETDHRTKIGWIEGVGFKIPMRPVCETMHD